MPATTRTAKDAAAAIGCRVEQIAKSLIFRTGLSGRPILVIASGSVRVAESKIAELVDEPIEKADADFVREMTGFAIGGVPPVGHAQVIETFIDESLAEDDRASLLRHEARVVADIGKLVEDPLLGQVDPGETIQRWGGPPAPWSSVYRFRG